MGLYSHVTALLLLGCTHVQAYVQPLEISRLYSFDDTLVNATVAVDFNGYNVTEPYSNSSEATTPWQARLKIRNNVHIDEHSPVYDPDDDKFDYYHLMTQISLTYDVEDSGDVESPDDSWRFCMGVQPLYNISINVSESADSSCGDFLGQECLDWLQAYVNDGFPCSSSDGKFIYDDIAEGPCSKDFFPKPDDDPWDQEIFSWSTTSNLSLSGMNRQYMSEMFRDEDDTDEYDAALSRVFILLASWGERNGTRSRDGNSWSNLNGTVVCLKPNETTEGSRTFQEAEEDSAMVLGGKQSMIFGMAIAAAVTLFTFVI